MNRFRFLVPIVGLWLAWVVILFAYQELAPARLQLAPPDRSVMWTAQETMPHSQDKKPYLNDPFLNTHVAWDSEFYLSIAAVGYNDPQVHHILDRIQGASTGIASAGGPPPGVQRAVSGPPPGIDSSMGKLPEGLVIPPEGLSLSHAFMPFYPHVMRLFIWPLLVLGMTPIATTTLAGVLVSILGTLGAMIALYDLTRDELGEKGGLRTAFYLLIFPTGFFLAQVYTEGLFVGLAFGSLALIRRKHWLLASLLAVGAVWTRAVGLGLVIPLAWAFWQEVRARDFKWLDLVGTTGLHLLMVLLPLAAYWLWQNSQWGQAFQVVEQVYFHRGLFMLSESMRAWAQGWDSIFSDNSQGRVYYLLEFGAIALGLVTAWREWRHNPDIALFSLAVVVVSLTSGAAQGMLRYVLTAPAVFTVLARWGRNEVFDKSWTIASVLLMGLTATLYTFNFWAG